MYNLPIRNLADKASVKFWEIALELHVSESTVTRMLRRQLSQEEREQLIQAIRTIALRHCSDIEEEARNAKSV